MKFNPPNGMEHLRVPPCTYAMGRNSSETTSRSPARSVFLFEPNKASVDWETSPQRAPPPERRASRRARRRGAAQRARRPWGHRGSFSLQGSLWGLSRGISPGGLTSPGVRASSTPETSAAPMSATTSAARCPSPSKSEPPSAFSWLSLKTFATVLSAPLLKAPPPCRWPWTWGGTRRRSGKVAVFFSQGRCALTVHGFQRSHSQKIYQKRLAWFPRPARPRTAPTMDRPSVTYISLSLSLSLYIYIYIYIHNKHMCVCVYIYICIYLSLLYIYIYTHNLHLGLINPLH